jgi:hypothetical protein
LQSILQSASSWGRAQIAEDADTAPSEPADSHLGGQLITQVCRPNAGYELVELCADLDRLTLQLGGDPNRAFARKPRSSTLVSYRPH